MRTCVPATVSVYSATRLAGSHMRLEGQPKALVHTGAGDALTVLLAYTLSAGHLVPPLPHGCLHVADDTGCRIAREEKAFALGEQILRLRVAAPVPADHRKGGPFRM